MIAQNKEQTEVPQSLRLWETRGEETRCEAWRMLGALQESKQFGVHCPPFVVTYSASATGMASIVKGLSNGRLNKVLKKASECTCRLPIATTTPSGKSSSV
jgi:AAA+ superfamily predicted ATPase